MYTFHCQVCQPNCIIASPPVLFIVKLTKGSGIVMERVVMSRCVLTSCRLRGLVGNYQKKPHSLWNNLWPSSKNASRKRRRNRKMTNRWPAHRLMSDPKQFPNLFRDNKKYYKDPKVLLLKSRTMPVLGQRANHPTLLIFLFRLPGPRRRKHSRKMESGILLRTKVKMLKSSQASQGPGLER